MRDEVQAKVIMGHRNFSGTPCGICVIVGVLIATSCSLVSSKSYEPPALTDSHPQASAIRDLMSRFLGAQRAGLLDTTSYRKCLTGEAVTTLAAVVPGLAEQADVIVLAAEGGAVARVEVKCKDGIDDGYFGVTRVSDAWKIETLRSFCGAGSAREVLAKCGAITRESVQSFEVRNALLVVMRDSQLRRWFFSHSAELDCIATIATRDLKAESVVTYESVGDAAGEIGLMLRELGLLSLRRNEDGSIKLVVGGYLDNQIALLHVPSGPGPVAGSEGDVGWMIWVEPLGHGWYFFRTT